MLLQLLPVLATGRRCQPGLCRRCQNLAAHPALPCLDTAQEGAAGLSENKTTVDATVDAGPANNAAQLVEGSRAAAEESSGALERTRRAQALRTQLAECRAHKAEAFKALSASRAGQEKLEAGQQGPTSHHGD